jgi:hypothetical protein
LRKQRWLWSGKSPAVVHEKVSLSRCGFQDREERQERIEATVKNDTGPEFRAGWRVALSG